MRRKFRPDEIVLVKARITDIKPTDPRYVSVKLGYKDKARYIQVWEKDIFPIRSSKDEA